MLNRPEKQTSSHYHSPLARWVEMMANYSETQIRFRLKGNSLHLLCEGEPCPEQTPLLLKVVHLLKHSDLNRLKTSHQPPIYTVRIYGRSPGQKYPEWSKVIHLNQLDRHFRELQQTAAVPEAFPHEFSPQSPESHALTQPTSRPSSASTRSATVTRSDPPSISPPVENAAPALALSPQRLAQGGQPDAIARYLSETLNALGISVKVVVKTLPHPQRQRTPDSTADDRIKTVSLPSPPASDSLRRLWITCEAIYSPDPTVIGEPIARQLRELDLEGFRDAAILVQVRGEDEPDWSLRVDLTPTTDILTEWARWGDVEAISRLIKQTLEPNGITLLNASLNDVTLHLFFGVFPSSAGAESADVLHDSHAPDQSPKPVLDQIPNQKAVRDALASLFDRLSPQGIHAAALYGQEATATTPAWVEWLNLPASRNPDLSASVLTLAEQADLEAIAFLIHRRLNPDLNSHLATGGIRIQILPKHDLLHIMCDAPMCPAQSVVVPQIASLLQSLEHSSWTGIRMYGRRAGQRRPLWNQGVDFIVRPRFVPDPTPEFAATDAYVSELLTPPNESVIRPNLTAEDLRIGWTQTWKKVAHAAHQALVRSHLFALTSDVSDLSFPKPTQPRHLATRTALVWGAVGLLLMVQVDWLLGRLQSQSVAQSNLDETESVSVSPASPSDVGEGDNRAISGYPPVVSQGEAEFDSQEFTQSGDMSSVSSSTELTPFITDDQELPTAPSIRPEWLENSPYPAFNSDQLDLKLALYYQRLAESGPPDVLLIGSSRTLRGIDPAALEHYLDELGYADLDVFNFGINGATAQVIELVLRRILTPEQLPGLIIWADGARAFNSGRADVTYNGIAASEAYEQISNGSLSIPNPMQSGGDRSTSRQSNGVFDGSTLWSGGIGATLTESYDALDSWLNDQLAKLSAGYDERDRLKSLIQDRTTELLPVNRDATDSIQSPIQLPDALGNGDEAPAAPESDTVGEAATRHGQIDVNGFLPLEIHFDPATYYQQYAHVPGNYDKDYQDFRLQGKQTEALQAILQFGETFDVPIVFANLPMTYEYLDPYRMEHEQEFRQYMLNASLNHSGFIFRDWGEIWLNDPDYRSYFSDPSHLNRYGALKIAKRLAQDPMIPWSNTP
ncbi:MAG: hypothetical protein ACFE0I_08280 [Elainellaceae cyanobacterium]